MSDPTAASGAPIIGSVEVPVPSSFGTYLRFWWLANLRNRDAGFGGFGPYLLLGIVVVMAITSRPTLIVVGALFGVVGVWVVASMGLAWRGSVAASGAIVGPGGVDSVFPSHRNWFPSTAIVRWSLVGPCLTIRTVGSLMLLDTRGLPPGSDQVIGALLAQPPPDPRDRPGGATVASWALTRDCVERNQRSSFWAPPERWLRRARVVLAAFASIVVLVAADRLSRKIRDGGWSSATDVSSADALAVLLIALALTAVGVAVVVVLRRRGLARSADGSMRTFVVDDLGCSLVAEVGTSSFTWTSIASLEVDDGWVVLRTAAPVVGMAVPQEAFAPGALDQLRARVPASARA
jgi:hypothetical protein